MSRRKKHQIRHPFREVSKSKKHKIKYLFVVYNGGHTYVAYPCKSKKAAKLKAKEVIPTLKHPDDFRGGIVRVTKRWGSACITDGIFPI